MNTRRRWVPAERLHTTPSFILPGDPDCNDFSNGTLVGRNGAVGIATLRAEPLGDRIPVGARFSTPVQTDPGAYPASYIRTMSTG